MSEGSKKGEIVDAVESPEAKHNSVITRMRAKVQTQVSQKITTWDMDPSALVTDLAKTAGYITMAYGVYSLITGEPSLSTENTSSKILNLLTGAGAIKSGSVLVKAAEAASNPKDETAVQVDTTINNFYLAKAYVKDFLDHTKIKK